MKKVLFPILALVLALGLTLPIAAKAHAESDPLKVTLYAGQTIDVGEVNVWNDGSNLYVKYQTNADWVMMETHLAVATSLDDIPQTKPKGKGKGNVGGNPIPGHFPYEHEDLGGVTSDGYTIPLSGLVGGGDTLYIAAHAVVQRVIVIEETPYYASVVVDYEQGTKKDGNPVREQRSDPANALDFETGRNEANFFSLGFGGWIILEYDCPIRDGEGDDVQVIEDTWGSYPLETADVYASQDGSDWKRLGEADNTYSQGIHTISQFDLNGILEWAKYIKVVDTTDPTLHNGSADGFDLNAVASLQDCIQEQEETAWADGPGFPGKNWATYFKYTVQES